MFKSQFEKYIDEAKKLSNGLYDLNKSMDRTVLIDPEEEIAALMKKQGAKFKNQVLDINPLTQPSEEQEKLSQQIKDLKNNLFNETLTLSRDQFLNKVCRLQLNLHTLCSLAQASLIENLELKHNAHNRAVLIKFGRLKEHISTITEDDIINTFKHILETYQFLSESMQGGAMIQMSLMFKPDKNTPAEVATYYYKIRAAVHTDNIHYQRFKEMTEALSDTKVLASFNQFMDGHPDSRHLSKKLLNELMPIMEGIKAGHSQSLQSCKDIVETIESARNDDFREIMSRQ